MENSHQWNDLPLVVWLLKCDGQQVQLDRRRPGQAGAGSISTGRNEADAVSILSGEILHSQNETFSQASRPPQHIPRYFRTVGPAGTSCSVGACFFCLPMSYPARWADSHTGTRASRY